MKKDKYLTGSKISSRRS